MNTSYDPSRPDGVEPRRDPLRTGPLVRDSRSDEGLGAIIAVVAVAALIIVGLLYSMSPAPEPAPRQTSEVAPTQPAPAPRPAAPAQQ